MPKLVRKVGNLTSPFAQYDGPPVKAGVYYATISKMVLTQSNAGNPQFRVWAKFDDDREGKVQYAGYDSFTMVTLTDNEYSLGREADMYRAITGKRDVDNVNIVLANKDENGVQAVLKIDGVNPVGRRVGIDMKNRRQEDGEFEVRPDGIVPCKGAQKVSKATAADDVEEDEDIEDDEDEVGLEEEMEAREAELSGMKLAQLRTVAKKAGVETTGLSKVKLIDAIIAVEFADDEEDEDEDEDESNPEQELRDELSGLDRASLKIRLKKADASFKVLRKHSDEDLVDAIVAAELSDEDAEEDDDEPPF